MSAAILRYPGGKGRFAPILAQNVLDTGNRVLIEPFAGGAAAGLTLLKFHTIDQLVLVEKDPRVAAFWRKLRDDPKFSTQVSEFKWASKTPHTKDEAELARRRDVLQEVLDKMQKNDLGMWTLVKNRCSFGGYLNGGLLLKGFGRPTKTPYEYYEGVGSQWNGDSLAVKIRSVHELFQANKIQFYEGDAFTELPKFPSAFAFIDPPYTHGEDSPGEGLYQENQVDHERLFQILSARKGPWLATYNNCVEVRELANKYQCQIKMVKMSRLHADTDQQNLEQYSEIIICPEGQKLTGDKIMGRPKGSKNKAEESAIPIPTPAVTETFDTTKSDIIRLVRDARLLKERALKLGFTWQDLKSA